MSQADDALHRFRLERAGVRGGLVRLESAWSELLGQADYPPSIARLLGETLAASALLSGLIKFEGSLSIQLRSGGVPRLLFAECSDDGGLRGIVRWEGEVPATAIDIRQPSAQLAITIENSRTATRYQGLVAVETSGLAGALEGYFAQSEQLPTRIVLAQHGGRCAGMILQPLAGEGGSTALGDADAWDRVGHLLATLGTDELLHLPVETLLFRLFHEEQVRLEPGRPLRFACSCSTERVSAMLRALGRVECEAALDADGAMGITCEFCNRQYRLDRVDLGLVFADSVAPAPARPQ
ncbi:Hsp33 family molecular chaperone HslO [Dokdonella sp.]|uniref:Hsp33 family molecular chaperone HslO n=1 Tax=Dokdonella sp. TaxID=2291710 RepID=UPI0025C2F9E1|nr:Hsp33 family molecular chaperone HslO [Dokdonella sp.]MBX3692202.1 Hsp33 family molecular chaperone HslO [Dokdonella sp.]MCW5567292.1 Hsp33 family molecular chaperone HslO [Dokdonella sp.]